MNVKEDAPIYNIEEGDYRKYIEINGIKHSRCAQALAVKDLNAKYFIVYKDDEFYTDFCIYKKDNWLTLDKKYFFEEELIDLIISYISVEVNYVTIYLPIEDDKLYMVIKNTFKNIEETEYIQDRYKYRCLKIKLEEN